MKYLVTGSLSEAYALKAEHKERHPDLITVVVSNDSRISDLPAFPSGAAVYASSLPPHVSQALREQDRLGLIHLRLAYGLRETARSDA